MKTESKKNLKVISNANSIRFEEDVNSLLESLKDSKELNVQFNTTTKGHYAYVTWENEILVPEDIRDEYILRGEKHTCGECPYFTGNQPVKDAHAIRDCSSCSLRITTKRVRVSDSACLYLYQQLAKGEVILYDTQ